MINTNETYCLITGASEGLGKAMALECASRNMNLILVSLPGIELYQLASYIRRRYSVKVCMYELNLLNENSRLSLWRSIVENNLSVNMLINNAGCGGSSSFDESDFADWHVQIQLNVTSVVHLTHLLLPALKRHPKSYILNISSLCIFFYLPKKQVYGAAKSFIYFFSKSLRKELKKDNVSVSVICPGGMTTTPLLYLLNTRGNWITRAARLSPEEAAPIAIDGLLSGRETIIPGKWSRFFMQLDNWLPKCIKNNLINNQVENSKQQYAESLIKGHPLLKGKTAQFS